MEKSQIDKAICEALAKGRKWDNLLAVAKRLEAFHTFSEEGFRFFIMAAKGARKWPELAAEAKKRLDENPVNSAAMQALVLAESRQGNWARAAEWTKKLAGDRSWPVEGAETLAWNAILAGKADQETLSAFQEWKTAGSARPDYHYTEAILDAALQKPEDAAEALLRGIAAEDFFHLHPAAWIAYARICQQYGYDGEAEKAMTSARTTVHDYDGLTDWVEALLH
jgi:hypothetical protein